MKYMNKSIEELHELLKEGKVTERELIDESLKLSKKVEEENNAFVTILDNIEEKEITDNLLSGIPLVRAISMASLKCSSIFFCCSSR